MQRRGRTIRAAHPAAKSALAWPSHVAEPLSLPAHCHKRCKNGTAGRYQGSDAHNCCTQSSAWKPSQPCLAPWTPSRQHRPRRPRLCWPCPWRHRTSSWRNSAARLCGVGAGPESCKYVATAGNLSMYQCINVHK